MSGRDNQSVEHELEVLLAKPGADVPVDRKAGVLSGYRDFKRLTELLRQPRTAAAEPSNIYSLTQFIGGKKP